LRRFGASGGVGCQKPRHHHMYLAFALFKPEGVAGRGAGLAAGPGGSVSRSAASPGGGPPQAAGGYDATLGASDAGRGILLRDPRDPWCDSTSGASLAVHSVASS
jgi:hypothetical protein